MSVHIKSDDAYLTSGEWVSVKVPVQIRLYVCKHDYGENFIFHLTKWDPEGVHV